MSDAQKVHIWPPETGITDLPEDVSRLTLDSMKQLREVWAQRREELAGSEALAVFSEQLQREWAIETGQIENLYDIERGVTVTLIEQGFQAAVLEHGSTNKPAEEVLALITDQKAALQGLFDFVKQDRSLSVGYIKELHAAMTRSQPSTTAFDLKGNPVEVELLRGQWKRSDNYPMRDGRQFFYCPAEQTAPQMERLVELHLAHMEKGVSPETEAAWLHHRFTQIHPFQDGNGRVARALASLVLIRGGMFPLIVPRGEKSRYLEALERADIDDVRPLVLLIGRRQQTEYQKANDLIAKMAPDHSNAADAADALARAVLHSDESRRARIRQHIEMVANLIDSLMPQFLQRSIDKLRAANPQASLINRGRSNVSLTTEPTLDDILRQLDGEPIDQAYRSMWLVNVPYEWQIAVYLVELESDLDERVVAIPFLVRSDKYHLLAVPPFAAGIGALPEPTETRVAQWLDQVITKSLDEVRRSNYG